MFNCYVQPIVLSFLGKNFIAFKSTRLWISDKKLLKPDIVNNERNMELRDLFNIIIYCGNYYQPNKVVTFKIYGSGSEFAISESEKHALQNGDSGLFFKVWELAELNEKWPRKIVVLHQWKRDLTIKKIFQRALFNPIDLMFKTPHIVSTFDTCCKISSSSVVTWCYILKITRGRVLPKER